MAIETEMTSLAKKRSEAGLPSAGAAVRDIAGKPASEGRKAPAGRGG
jgi:hypothetical protein